MPIEKPQPSICVSRSSTPNIFMLHAIGGDSVLLNDTDLAKAQGFNQGLDDGVMRHRFCGLRLLQGTGICARSGRPILDSPVATSVPLM
jgi:hypothetical protein